MSSSSKASDIEVPVLVSACLLGCACRFDGRDNADGELQRALVRDRQRAVAFCPEEEGGLSTPRSPAWIESDSAAAVLAGEDRVVSEDGEDVTEAYLRGARKAVELCKELGIRRAYLKERSPSCGVNTTHVQDELANGPGLTTEFLARAGIEIIGIEGRRT